MFKNYQIKKISILEKVSLYRWPPDQALTRLICTLTGLQQAAMVQSSKMGVLYFQNQFLSNPAMAASEKGLNMILLKIKGKELNIN